jgi:hypothetical protein
MHPAELKSYVEADERVRELYPRTNGHLWLS